MNSTNDLQGSVTLIGGRTDLVDMGTMNQISSLTIRRGVFDWNDTGSQAMGNRLSSSVPITLTGGALRIDSRADSQSSPTR